MSHLTEAIAIHREILASTYRGRHTPFTRALRRTIRESLALLHAQREVTA